jgi:HEPN domain-containing protein
MLKKSLKLYHYSTFFVSLPRKDEPFMKKRLLFWLTIALSVNAFAQGQQDFQALLREIDEAIEQSPQVVANYEQEIAETRRQYLQARTPEEKYLLAFKLYEQNKSFMNDSALFYLNEAQRWVAQQGKQAQVGNCLALEAFQCSTVGYYNEALVFLSRIDKHQLDSIGLRNYYQSQMHVYGELGYYSLIPPLKEQYFRLQSTYRDSLFAVIDHQDKDYLMYRIQELRGHQQFEEGRKLSDQWVKRTDPESRDYAIATYYRWMVSEDPGEVRYWIAQSALSDVRHAVMDQASLLTLADLLNADGDLDRSYRYIRFTWDCNNRFNTRMRSWQITPILNVIEKNYQSAVDHNTRVLRMSIIVVSVLALLLLGVLFFLHRRNRQLDAARSELKVSNEELASLNAQLSTQKEELSTLNTQLSTLNSQLSESNTVKEEYIGRFMSLCSQYIDKLDNYRKMVNKKMKNKELDELFQISKSTELKERELEELLQNFDSVFLHLFPHFVSDFNALLQPEMQIHPKDENRLVTEIRIFALIRLGIEDSSKIAEFLHYSVNTIYNYRARIKNGALDNRESFERRVKLLGMPQ